MHINIQGHVQTDWKIVAAAVPQAQTGIGRLHEPHPAPRGKGIITWSHHTAECRNAPVNTFIGWGVAAPTTHQPHHTQSLLTVLHALEGSNDIANKCMSLNPKQVSPIFPVCCCMYSHVHPANKRNQHAPYQ